MLKVKEAAIFAGGIRCIISAAGKTPLIGKCASQPTPTPTFGHRPNALNQLLRPTLLPQYLQQLFRANHQLHLPKPRWRRLLRRPLRYPSAFERHPVRRR